MAADPTTAAAASAATVVGAAAGVVTGQPPDIVLIAALAGSICSAWYRPGSAPEWSARYVCGTLVHMLLSCGAGLSSSALLPAAWPDMATAPAWAVAFPTAAGAHVLIPEIHRALGELRGALIERIRGRADGSKGQS